MVHTIKYRELDSKDVKESKIDFYNIKYFENSIDEGFRTKIAEDAFKESHQSAEIISSIWS